MGKLAPPAWSGGFVQIYIDPENPLVLRFVGQAQRKYEESLNKVMGVAKQLHKDRSIYQGNAVELNMKFIAQCQAGNGFNPEDAAPEFTDVSAKHKLILPLHIQDQLEDIWNMIRHPEYFWENGDSTKLSVLLQGPFGVGKTLASYCTAQVCVENKWSFMKLKTPQYFQEAYEMAIMHSPRIVLFVEDCDAIFSGGRTPKLNAILDTLDGIGKNNQIILFFTTNNPDAINPAVMRTGRIDRVLRFGKLDGEAAGRFIHEIAGPFLTEDVDLDKAGAAFDGLVPADITEGIKQAKGSAIGKFGPAIKGRVNTEMLVMKGKIMQDKVNTGREESPEAQALRAIRLGEALKHSDGAVKVAK
jgi:hypothetical protein